MGQTGQEGQLGRQAARQAGEQARILPKVYAPWNAYTRDLDSPELAKHWHTTILLFH